MNNTINYTLTELPILVAELQKRMKAHRVFACIGSLGAGKTTLVRSLLQACGVAGVISSPTFTYVNIYTHSNGQKFYHFDLYRITRASEFIDAGFDEYLNDPQAYVFIEWPEVVMALLPKDTCIISLDYRSEHDRTITFTVR